MKKHITFFLSLLILSTLGAGSYDYIGPNRTVTTWSNERTQCFYTANYTNPVTHYHSGCSLTLYTDGGCPSAGSTAPYFNPAEHACGADFRVYCTSVPCSIGGPTVSIVGCSMGETGCRSVQHTTTNPAATIMGTVICSHPGANGWCTGAANLSLSSTEPVAGYNILGLEGTLNGETFSCGSPACTVPLDQGQNDFTFWALSSWGDSSAMGSASGRVDTQAPAIDGNLAGVAGSGGWFTSSVTVTASATDPAPGSGFSTMTYSLDGGAAMTYTGPLTLGDGSHAITFTATDVAGNSSTSTQTVNVDTGLPLISVDPISVTSGDNGWYTSGASISASADDPAPGSGLASLVYSLDGGTPTAYAGPIALSDGAHTIVFTATDAAGNSVSETRSVNVDTLAPQNTLNGDASFCPGCGDTLAVDYSVQDPTSGVASWTLSVDGSTLTSGIGATSGTFDWDGSGLAAGAHTLTLESRDLAGNVSQTTLLVTLLSPTPIPPGGGGSTVPTSTRTPRAQSGASGSSPTTIVPPVQNPNPTATSTKGLSNVAFNPPAPNTSSSGAGGSTSLDNPSASGSSGLLFGAEAAAAIGAMMAIVVAQRRKREEEEVKQAEEAAKFNSAMITWEKEQALQAYLRALDKKQKEAEEAAMAAEEQARQMFQAKLSQAQGCGLPPQHINDYIEMAKAQGYAAAIAALDSFIAKAKQDAANTKAFQEYMKQKEAQEAAEKARKEAEAAAEKARQEAEAAAAEAEKNKPWWQKAIDIIDQNQVLASVVVGIAAAVIVGAVVVATGGLAAPLAIGAIAALSAGVATGAGTIGLNAYYGRSWDQNLVRNIGISATTAFVCSVAPVVFQEGQTIVAASVPKACILLGAPALVTSVATTIAPVIGAASSLLALGSMTIGGVGMSLADDPTLSPEERELGNNLVVVGATGLGFSTSIFDTAASVNKSFETSINGSNTGNTSENAEILRGKMGVGDTPGKQAHHIAASTSNYSSAVRARLFLQKFGIDINSADNGVLLPESIHNGLANDYRYMDAVAKELSSARSKADAIRILQDIGQRLLEGTFPRKGN